MGKNVILKAHTVTVEVNEFRDYALNQLFQFGLPQDADRLRAWIPSINLGLPDGFFVHIIMASDDGSGRCKTNIPIELGDDETGWEVWYCWFYRVLLIEERDGSAFRVSPLKIEKYWVGDRKPGGWHIRIVDIEGVPEDQRIERVKRLADGIALLNVEMPATLPELITAQRGGDRRSKFKWTDENLLKFRAAYYDDALPTFQKAEEIGRAAVTNGLEARPVLQSIYSQQVDADLIIALASVAQNEGENTAASLALEQAARRVGVGKGDYKPSSLPTYLTRANRLHLKSNE